MKLYIYSIVTLMMLVQINTQAQSSNTRLLQRTAIDSNIILPPAWAFGLMYGGYTNQAATINRIEAIKKHNYPIDAYWIDSWFWSYADKGLGPQKYIDFVADTTAYPSREKMWNYLQDNHIKGGFWVWDCILEKGNEEAFNDFKQRGFFSSIYLNTNSWHNGSRSTAMFQDGKEQKGTQCGNIDFDNPEAVAYFKQKMKHFFDEGADFIKLDRTSKISTTKAMFEMSQEFGKETKGRGFILSHTGGQETEEYKHYPTKWTDDTRSDWTIEKPLIAFNSWVPFVALKENIAMYTDPNQKTSEIPFLTNDLGGFDMGKTTMPAEELYIRWLQFSIFNPITEVFSQPENPTANLAWMYSAKADSIFRFYAQWRMQLFPYIYSYAHRSRIEGKRMIGPIPGHLYQYMFGDELLVAPVFEQSAVKQTVYLPTGNWANYWTGERMAGNATYTIAVPLHQIPLFVKLGAIIPMRAYASSIEKGNNHTIVLQVYPGENGIFKLIEDDGTSNDYLSGIYASTVIEQSKVGSTYLVKIHPVEGGYNGMKTTRKWMLYFHCKQKPKHIKLNQQHLKFKFDREKGVAIVETNQCSIKQMSEFEVGFF